MDKETIKEVLELWQDYARWCYASDGAFENFNKTELEHKGIKFSLNLKEDGSYLIKNLTSGKTVNLLPAILCCQFYPKTIFNMDMKIKIINFDEFNTFPQEEKSWFHEVLIFVDSAFQRSCFNWFLANMHQTTQDQIVEQLYKGVQNS